MADGRFGGVPGWFMSLTPNRNIMAFCAQITWKYADYKHKTCWPSQSTLAEDMEVSVDTIRRWLEEMESLQLIVRWARHSKKGGRLSDFIAVCWEGPGVITEEQEKRAHKIGGVPRKRQSSFSRHRYQEGYHQGGGLDAGSYNTTYYVNEKKINEKKIKLHSPAPAGQESMIGGGEVSLENQSKELDPSKLEYLIHQHKQLIHQYEQLIHQTIDPSTSIPKTSTGALEPKPSILDPLTRECSSIETSNGFPINQGFPCDPPPPPQANGGCASRIRTKWMTRRQDEEILRKRRADAAVQATPPQTPSLAEETTTDQPPKSSVPLKYKCLAEYLAKTVQMSHKINSKSHMGQWSESIRRLCTIDLKDDPDPVGRVRKVLLWHREHSMDLYTPVIESADTLRRKWVNLEQAMLRHTAPRQGIASNITPHTRDRNKQFQIQTT